MTGERIVDGHARSAGPPALHRGRNILLRGLPGEESAVIEPYLEHARYEVSDEVARAGELIEQLVFPEAGIAAVLEKTDDDRRLAMGLVGREGFLGWPLLLGENRWPHDVLMRAEACNAVRLDADVLPHLLDQCPVFRLRLLRFSTIFTVQMAQSLVSSMIHPVDRRMARWILLYHDRVLGDEIFLTHEEFRIMLGVRRSSVTDALHKLESDQAVRALRGRVIVRDRYRLVELAGETYGRPERDYERLIGPPAQKSPRMDGGYPMFGGATLAT